MISEGQHAAAASTHQHMADVHRVTNSGHKYKMTVDNHKDGRNEAGLREINVNSTQSAYLKPSRSNTHSIIKRNFPMHNQPGHDNMLKGIMQPMPLESTDRERNMSTSKN